MAYEITVENGIATFTINRPEYRNAVNTDVMDGLDEFIGKVEEDETISFAVVTGTGDRAFCSGGDLSEFHKLHSADEAFPMLSRMTNLLYRLATLPVPVLALVNGAAVGGGCELATACDYRVVSKQAKAGFIQGTLAITTGWGGGTLLFEKAVKHDTAFRMLSEASVLSAEELVEAGWATALYEGSAKDGLDQFLQKMKSVHPSVHKAYKTMALRKWTADFLRDRMLEEARLCSELWEHEAHHEAVARFLKS